MRVVMEGIITGHNFNTQVITGGPGTRLAHTCMHLSNHVSLSIPAAQHTPLYLVEDLVGGVAWLGCFHHGICHNLQGIENL